MKLLAIDIDGVACAHASAICQKVNQVHGLKARHEDVKSWDHDFGPITFVQAVDLYYPDGKFILGMGTTPGFEDFLNRVVGQFDIVFATARKHSKQETSKWISERFGTGFEVQFVKRKCDLKPDILIDDYPGEVLSVAEQGGLGLLYVQPWNDNAVTLGEVGDNHRIRICQSFEQALSILLDQG